MKPDCFYQTYELVARKLLDDTADQFSHLAHMAERDRKDSTLYIAVLERLVDAHLLLKELGK